MAIQAKELTKDYQYGFSDIDVSVFRTAKGLSPEVVASISKHKNEPEWMLKFRLKALDHFRKRPMPTWGADLSGLDFENIYYYVKPVEEMSRSWDDVPDSIKQTFDRLGIPQAERKFLAGVSAQYDLEVVYHSIREDLEKQGVLFSDCDTGLREHEELFRKYFGTVIPPNDNKFAALNSAVWSGGSFVYVPKGVKVDIPLQAYFRINSDNMGQFERTLIIADEGSSVHYIEGCTAPNYSSDSLHSAVVELVAHKGAKIRYTTIQNWSDNVYNLVTKRAIANENATVEWIDGNLGSKVTMKYPSVYLMGEGAHAEVMSAAFAGNGQHQDAGSKAIHVAPNTTSNIVSRSISKGSGRTSYRGHIKVLPKAHNVKVSVRCDALLLDEELRSDTYPYMDIDNPDVTIGHEASVSKVGEDQIFYLTSRGIHRAGRDGTDRQRILRALRQGAADGVRGRAQPSARALHGGSDRVTTPLADSPAAALGQEVAAARAEASPAWLAARRRIAWDAYEAMPMPSSHRDEDWRRTDISALHPERFTPVEQRRSPRSSTRCARSATAPRRTAAFIIDSPVATPIEGADTLLAQGIIVTTLEEAATGPPGARAARVRLGACRRVEVRRALECALARRRLRVRPPRRRGARPGLDRPPRSRNRRRRLPVDGRRPRRGRARSR